jgi:hypothetical protein
MRVIHNQLPQNLVNSDISVIEQRKRYVGSTRACATIPNLSFVLALYPNRTPYYGAPSLNSKKTLSRCLLTENVEANKSVHCLIPKMALLDFPIAIYLSHGTTHSYPNSPPTISKCRTVNELSSTTSAYILSSKP